ncbi:MAG: 1-acyl-sn-glycerol-3-phosphate acyltransferase [Clostridia bacterium]|nr:1-acyl-sn-glycerol-3-phosphate acyltransferase [Clostridia bacterium]
MSNKEAVKKEPEKKVSPEKERTFVYTLLRVIACVGVHTIFPVKYYHKERYELKAPYITMSNHQSACDPIILAYPCKKYEVRFVGKKELNLNKFVEKVLAKLHMITVDRHNSDMAAMRLCAKTLRDGYVLGIFPEGTRHHNDLMEEVETGAAVLALRAKVPILPVYIESKPKFLRMNHVYIGEPMDISDLAAQGFNTEVVEALCGRIREAFFALRKECQERK